MSGAARRAKRKFLYHLQGGCCASCGVSQGAQTFEHVTPKHRGGEWRIDNLILTCVRCNRHRGSSSKLSKRAKEMHLTVLRWWYANGMNDDVRQWKILPWVCPHEEVDTVRR